MITRQDLIYNIRVKMDSDPNVDTEDYYLNYYDTLIDECLSVVANTVLPYQKAMEFSWGGYFEDDMEINNLDKTRYYTVGSGQISNGDYTAKRKDWIVWEQTGENEDDGYWRIVKKNTYGFLATIPNDFLSFSDEASVEYRNSYGELQLNVDILYVNSKTLALSKDGNYKIYYNAEYPTVKGLDRIEWLPTNVAKLIPSYVAGQLLSSEDPIKATQLKNEFELMLSRLDANKPLVAYNINNDSGWTL